jgi:phosphoenolpyruvate-protein kinase (PTS system EI component)
VLGLRGVRLGMRQPALLDTQLRAIVRAAAAGGTVRVLVPFVTSASEVAEVRRHLDLARAAVAAEGVAAPPVALGPMIEVPAAALAADHLAAVSDFMAVGTNDLVQYLLAADRTDQRLTALVSGLHPALLRLLRLLPRLAGRHGVPVSVCGELASQPAVLALLIGLGVREFSMTPAALGPARRIVEAGEVATLRRLSRHAVRTGDTAAVQSFVQQVLAGPSAAEPVTRT